MPTDIPTPTTSEKVPWSRADSGALLAMAAVVVALNAVGWGVLVGVVAPQSFSLGASGVFGVGLGVTAFLLGLRHAFDADHIAVVDNTTRKLVGEGKPALGVGFWFSLGHSTVVFVVAGLLAVGIRALAGPDGDASGLQTTLGVVGSVVAGAFLVLIGLTNLLAVAGIVHVARRMRSGELDEAELERHLTRRGAMARVLGRVMRRVDQPWKAYPVGLLMGLGFDTATQVSLLVLAAGSAAAALPWYAIMVLPVLFAAGMTLFDTADGLLMARAYRWAFVRPARKVFYNLTVTVLSVVVALGVGVVVISGLLTEVLQLETGPVAWLGNLDLETAGFVVVGLFLLTWGAALAIWRLARVEERWGTGTTV